MKKLTIILSLITALFMYSCSKKSDPQPVVTQQPIKKTCLIDINKIKDVLWISVDPVYANVKFYSNGNQYQSGESDATWSVTNGCDSIKITRGQGYYNRIISVSSDTLKLETPFSQITFHK